MDSSRRRAFARLWVRIALLAVALMLGAVAYTSSSLPALGGALVAAALGLRATDLSDLRRPAASATSPGPVTLAGTDTAPSAAKAVEPVDDENPAAILAALRAGVRARPNFALGLGAVVCGLIAASFQRINALTLLSAILWIAGIALIVAAGLVHDRRDAQTLPFRPLWTGLALGLSLGVLALLLRAIGLGLVPPYMHGDEGAQGTTVLRLLAGETPSFASTETSFGFAFVFPYLQSLGLRLFGVNEVGLRIMSAVFGAATVVITYFAAEAGFRSRAAGFISALLLAFHHLHLHYSRMAMPTIEAAPWAPLAFWMLLLANSQWDQSGPRRYAPYVISGVSAALAQYFYSAGRIVPILVGVWLLFMLIGRRVTWGQIGAVALGAFVAAAPILVEFVNRPEVVIGRAAAVSIFNENVYRHTLGADAQLPRDLGRLLVLQTQKMIEFFVFRGDSSGFYMSEFPPFDVLTSVLIWIGLGLALARIRRLMEFGLVTWIVLAVALGGVLQLDPPSGPRMTIAIPAIIMLAVLALRQTWRLVTSVSGMTLRWLVAPFIIAAIGIICYANYDTYFNQYARQELNGTGLRITREFALDQERYKAFVMGDPAWVNAPTVRFMASKATIVAVDTANQLPDPATTDQGIVVVAMAPKAAELDRYRLRFPGGASSSYTTPQGQLMFLTYRIPPK